MFTPVKQSVNPFLFVVGCPRSGTTLLTRILDAHPEIAMMHVEQHWIPRFFLKRIGVNADGTVSPELIEELFQNPKFMKIDFDQEEVRALLDGMEKITYADFVRRLFDLYGSAQKKVLVGEKTPGNALHVPVLHSLWPSSKIIHLIRDGRDVCLSVLSWKKRDQIGKRFRLWREIPVLGVAFWWRRHVLSAMEAGASLAPNLYSEIRYENIVQHAEEVCQELCSILGVDYSPRMPRFHEGKTKLENGRDAKHSWIGITPGLRDWRKDMKPEDVLLFETAAGDILENLGYQIAFSKKPREIIDQVQRYKDSFSEDAQSKTRPLPKSW